MLAALLAKLEDAHSHSSAPSSVGWQPSQKLLLTLVAAFASLTTARADFETVINSPPDTLDPFGRLDSNTQVNLFPGGVLPDRFDIGPRREPGDNIEINLLGGTIAGNLLTSDRRARNTNVTLNLHEGVVEGFVDATNGSLVTLTNARLHAGLFLNEGSLAIISGGQIDRSLGVNNGSSAHVSGGTIGQPSSFFFGLDDTTVRNGSTLLLTGGVINNGLSSHNSHLNISGGRIDGNLSIGGSSTVDWSGGSTGKLRISGGGSANIIGGDFRLDGAPIEGLASFPQPVTIPQGSVLTGVLRDGTPFALNETGFLQDRLSGGTLSLSLAPIPSAEPRLFDSAGADLPAGLRSGQSALLRPGGVAPNHFTTHAGAQVDIQGGEIGFGFEAIGTDITLTEGRIGERAVLLQGSTLRASGGEIGSNFELGAQSRFELSGGSVAGPFTARTGSEVHYTGGVFRSTLGAELDSSFTLTGGEFLLNGAPIQGLASPGESQQVDLPQGSVLSGTLSDGTPFVFSDRQHFAEGTLTLETTDLPAAAPSPIRVPGAPAPVGLRSGQTLLLSEGGELPDDFTANPGSVIRMTGGTIGHNFQTTGGLVNASGGEIETVDILLGSVVNFSGAESNLVSVNRGGAFNQSNGRVGRLHLNPGGHARVSGGVIDWGVNLNDSSTLTLSDGEVNDRITLRGGVLTIAGGLIRESINDFRGGRIHLRGGRLGDGLKNSPDSQITISGSDIRINGVPVQADEDPFSFLFSTEQIDLPEGSVLSGVFSDGTPFAFSPDDGDSLAPGTLTVNSPFFLATPRLGAPNVIPIDGLSFDRQPPPQGVLPGESVLLAEGIDVGDNFTAGWESTLTIDGGVVGNNFEAVGAVVDLQEGAIGDDADVFFGSELNVQGGSLGEGVEVHNGGVLNLSGGELPELIVRTGSTVNITGGVFGEVSDEGNYHGGSIALETGSELHIFGTDFFLNGESVEGLEPGGSVLIDLADNESPFLFSQLLEAVLLDGSPFAAFFDDLLFDLPFDGAPGVPRTVRLSTPPVVAGDLTIPEPSALCLLLLAATQAGRPRRTAR